MTLPRKDNWHYQGICLKVMEETQIYLLRTYFVPEMIGKEIYDGRQQTKCEGMRLSTVRYHNNGNGLKRKFLNIAEI